MWGGDWECDLADDNLPGLCRPYDDDKVDGTAAHKHTIERLNNASGMPMGSTTRTRVDLMTNKLFIVYQKLY